MERVLRVLKRIIPRPVFVFFEPAYHFSLAAVAVLFYRFPSRRMIVIGVTGTNGKTTVAHILHEIFFAAGYKVGSLSSLRFKINDSEEPNLLKMTMPGRMRLQKFLADCRASGCRFVILEVTSQGIKQFRHSFIRFKAAVLTNIKAEHIEAHGGFEKYRSAKMELFKGLPSSGFAVLNQEDESSELIAAQTPAQIVWYSSSNIELKRVGHPVRLITVESRRLQFEIDDTFFETGLGGRFNAMNILAAASAALAFNVSLSAIAAALKNIGGIPGRLEYIQEHPFSVVVDYAVTPDALESVYKTLSSASSKLQAPSSKLICVFGSAGGGRDRWKRPELGKIAARFCQEIILTSDDPDDEDPALIVFEIQSGMPKDESQKTKVVLDRREAIRTALEDARPGDTVIITGMGAQPWFIGKGGKIPWDERAIVREELRALGNCV